MAVLILLTSCQQTCMTYTIAACTVKKTPDDGQRNCPKHVDFYAKNKFEKLVHLVGVPSWSCSQALSKPVWYIPLLCVQWKTPDGGQRDCLKHVEFYSKNKFEKLVLLVSFIIRIYHDARSPERQNTKVTHDSVRYVNVRGKRLQ